MWKLDCEECWAPKNWCFWTVVLEKTLEVPWTARRSNQCIPKEISPGICLEGLMLKLKLQYFGHLMQRVDSLEKTLMLGGIGGRRRRGQQRMRWLVGITDSMDVGLSELRSWWWTGRPGVLRVMGSQRVEHNWVTELNWRKIWLSYGLFHWLIVWINPENTINQNYPRKYFRANGKSPANSRNKWIPSFPNVSGGFC